jgi:hypothetical protein
MLFFRVVVRCFVRSIFFLLFILFLFLFSLSTHNPQYNNIQYFSPIGFTCNIHYDIEYMLLFVGAVVARELYVYQKDDARRRIGDQTRHRIEKHRIRQIENNS